MTKTLPITTWLLVVLLTFYHSVGYANTLLIWPDSPDGRLYRIDVQKKLLEAETKPAVWQALGEVQMSNVAVDAFPPSTRITCLPDGKGRFCYFLVDCTQQVYRFDKQTRMLERVDKTFFRGYNCYSAKFIRKDTLYSFGGYGFWHSNNILSYYRATNQEWESLNPSVDSPKSIYRGFNGYIEENNSFFSALSLHQNDSENKGAFISTDSVYTYSFKQRNWQRLGLLTSTFKQYLPEDFIQKASWFQVGRYFILKYYANPQIIFLIVDPIRNEARIWKDTNKLLANLNDNYENDNQRSYVWKDALYLRHDVTGATGKTLQIIRLPITNLWKNSRPIGAFYESFNTPNYNWLFGLVIAVILLVAGIVFKRKQLKRSKISRTLHELPAIFAPYPNSLSNKEKDVFDALVKAISSDGLNAEALNEILGIGDKSLDNQRKIRAEIIKGLNLKLKLEWEIEDAVERVPTTLDQRMFTYALKADVFKHIQENQNNSQTERR